MTTATATATKPRTTSKTTAKQARKTYDGPSAEELLVADLVAVRPDDGSMPVWPDAMADHYDLPPYAD